MIRQHLIWTALPNGFISAGKESHGSVDFDGQTFKAGATVRLSVHVAPRLLPDPGGPQTLQQFPDFQRWPRVVAKAPPDAYTVRFFFQGDAQPLDVKATRVDLKPDVRLEPDLWRSLFLAGTPVRPYEFDSLADRRIRSYPVGSIARFVEGRYQRSALSQGRTMDRAHLAQGGRLIESLLRDDMFGPVSIPPDAPQRPSAENLKERSAKTLTGDIDNLFRFHGAAIPAAATAELADGVALDFMQARLFHTQMTGGTGQPAGELQPPDYDFHDAIAFLGQYPGLLRMLGLIIDLEVPLATLPDSPQDETVRVAVLPDFVSDLDPGTVNFYPRTAYRLDHERKHFQAAASPDSDLQDGLLKLGTDAYKVVQLDTDSAVELLLNFAYNLQRLSDPDIATADTPKLAEPPALRTGGIALIRNDRAVQLHDRFQKSKVLNAQGIDDGNAERLMLGAEDLVRGYRIDVLTDGANPAWHSLCRRVGRYTFERGDVGEKNIRDEGFVTTGVTQAPVSDEQQPGSKRDLFLHESLCRWDGWSLSARRPGKAITNEEMAEELPNSSQTFLGLETTFKPEDGALPRLRFGRRYRLRARAVDLAGNSLPPGGDVTVDETLHTGEVTYTRFEPVVAPVVVVLQEPKEGESLERMVICGDAESPTTGVSERLLAPPKCSPLLAETHGMFDTPEGWRQDAYELITAHEGTFSNVPEEVQPEVHGWYRMPYLPDPLSRGVTFVFVLNDATPLTFQQCNFGNDVLSWPDAKPWRLRLVEHTAPELPDAQAELESRFTTVDGERTMLVRLRKSDVARLLISSSIRPDDLELMGVWHWLNTDATDANELELLKQLIPFELHPMFTPGRLLTLVNAVQRPLQVPDLFEQFFGLVKKQAGSESDVRAIGDTFVNIYGALSIHGQSTGKLDLHAEWSELVDDPREPAFNPKRRRGQAHVEEIPLPDPSVDATVIEARHEFGDTKYRVVKYGVTATTRFREYFPPEQNGQKTVLSRAGATVTCVVPNSARPAAPKVLYVVPIFKWTKSELKGVTKSKRMCGLRVYLERPWYSSGDGEKLAVVLSNIPGAELSEDVAPYVSCVGIDPTRVVSPVQPLAPKNFPNRLKMEVASELSLEELPPQLSAEVSPGVFLQQTQVFTIVPHNVAYNADRNLWYCDIKINPNNTQTYYPFVRLALARYQHNSVRGAHLSRVALTDFIHLAPDRLVTITRSEVKERGLVHIEATLTGVGHAGSVSPGGQSNPAKLAQTAQPIFMTIERKTAIGHGDLGWEVIAKSKFFDLDAGDAGQLTQTPPENTMLRWNGAITIEKDKLGDTRKLRLAIREYENYRHDPDALGGATMIPRLVFVDHITAFPAQLRAAD